MATDLRSSNGAAQATLERQARLDRYYMDLAEAVRAGSNCTGTAVGAVIVIGSPPRGERVVATGYNGTPGGFTNCRDGGCVRCKRRDEGKIVSGEGLDWCVCVHAEQNALLSAARFGISVADSILYSTAQPCPGCLKEMVQAGVKRAVFRDRYPVLGGQEISEQYDNLASHLELVQLVESFELVRHREWDPQRSG